MRIAYVEDDVLQKNVITDTLMNCLSNEGIEVSLFDLFSTADDFLKVWYPRRYDLIILDIYIHEDSGIDIARKIRLTDMQANIVFISTSNDFACESYDVSALYYLTKPVDYNKINSMVQALSRKLNIEKQYAVLPDGKRIIVSDIIHTHYFNHVITMKYKQGQPLKVRISQKEFLDSISNYAFLIGIDQGTVINLKEVASYDNNAFVMSDGSIQVVCRRRKEEVLRRYRDYVFGELRRK